MLMQCAYMFCLPYDMQYVYLFVLLILPHLISIWVFVKSYKNIILDKWTNRDEILYLIQCNKIWFSYANKLLNTRLVSFGSHNEKSQSQGVWNHWMDEKQNLPKRMQNVELTPSSKHHSICHQKMMLCLFCIFSFSYSS